MLIPSAEVMGALFRVSGKKCYITFDRAIDQTSDDNWYVRRVEIDGPATQGIDPILEEALAAAILKAFHA